MSGLNVAVAVVRSDKCSGAVPPRRRFDGTNGRRDVCFFGLPERWAPSPVIHGVVTQEMAKNKWVCLGLFHPTDRGTITPFMTGRDRVESGGEG